MKRFIISITLAFALGAGTMAATVRWWHPVAPLYVTVEYFPPHGMLTLTFDGTTCRIDRHANPIHKEKK